MSQPCSSILLIVIKRPVLINVRVDAAQVLTEFTACVEVYPGNRSCTGLGVLERELRCVVLLSLC